ncbi:MAG: hypothetical protein ACRCTD_06980 [Beijerinckiaceae bacterium]
MTKTFQSIRALALTGALALTAFAGSAVVTAGDAEARGFRGGGGGGRVFHGGHFGGRHAFHHRPWHHRHHRWGWGAPLVVGGLGVAAVASDCYIARQRVWSNAYGNYVVRRVRVCD